MTKPNININNDLIFPNNFSDNYKIHIKNKKISFKISSYVSTLFMLFIEIIVFIISLGFMNNFGRLSDNTDGISVIYEVCFLFSAILAIAMIVSIAMITLMLSDVFTKDRYLGYNIPIKIKYFSYSNEFKKIKNEYAMIAKLANTYRNKNIIMYNNSLQKLIIQEWKLDKIYGLGKIPNVNETKIIEKIDKDLQSIFNLNLLNSISRPFIDYILEHNKIHDRYLIFARFHQYLVKNEIINKINDLNESKIVLKSCEYNYREFQLAKDIRKMVNIFLENDVLKVIKNSHQLYYKELVNKKGIE